MAEAQFENIMIHEGPAQSGPEEPVICISPRNPDEIRAGANIQNAYRSKDGGRTWEHRILTSRYGVWGDPVIVANSKGRFFFFHLSDPTGQNWASDEILDRIVVQRSRRWGSGWSKGWYTGWDPPKDQDKEWACVDPVSGRIALAWTQFDDYGSEKPEDKSSILFSISDPSGKKWSTPMRINQFSGNCLDDDQTTEGAVPAFGPNGEIYVSWAWNDTLWFDYSLDGGQTWQDTDGVISRQPGGCYSLSHYLHL
ncbi:MAG: exo-alpha-sialidase [Leptolyngbya sp. SIO3F4]|nr:exo-alpha-sialidase [Leptolyngbya sp. SIO3F4]